MQHLLRALASCRPSLVAALVLAAGCGSPDDAPPLPSPAPPIDVSFLDRSADPCTDFYQFACGTWIREHPVSPGFVTERFLEGDLRNSIYFERLIRDTSNVDRGVEKAEWYAASCMDVWNGTSADFAPVQALLDAIDGITDLGGFARILSALHASGVDALFGAGPQIDGDDPTRYVLAVYGTGWSLPTKEAYDPSNVVRTSYEDHVRALANALFVPGLDATTVVDFEANIALAADDPTVRRDPVATWNPTTVTEFEGATPGFDFATYFHESGYDPIDRLDVMDPGFFASLSDRLSASSLDVVKQYLKWRVLEATAETISRTAIDEEYGFHGTIVAGRTEPPASWACYSAARARFGFPLAKAFVDRFVPNDTLPLATRVVDDIRTAFEKDLSAVPWLDDQTRASALEKLGALEAHVGYPSAWPSYDQVNVTVDASYLENLLALSKESAEGKPKQLSGPVDPDAWLLSPSTTNAIYVPPMNSITVPVAILEDPFFDVDWPRGLNLAALGTVIGHEMTHGFDDAGRHYDSSGALRDWWADSVAAEFTSRAACLVDQFDGYEPVPGNHVNGALTLGENIADLGGLKLSFSAYRAAKSPLPLTQQFTANQEFFLAFAQLNCANESPEYLTDALANDPHSPTKFRVNGTVRNVPGFAEAFRCAAGATLAPAEGERCELW